MSKLASARSKISNALFSTFGEQGFLIKNGVEFNVYAIKQDKSFNLKEGFNVTSSSIKIQSTEKPELRNTIKLNDKEYIIKASPTLLGNNIYEVRII